MPKTQNTFVADLLQTLKELGGLLPLPFETPYKHQKRLRRLGPKHYYDSLYYLRTQGLVEVFKKNNIGYIKLTARGNIETLLSKAKIDKQSKWDKFWRLVIFDIPEQNRNIRSKLRWLLKKNNFYKLQASVFISPYSLNREAIAYLKETRLINYIRILKISEIDDDRDIKKIFKLR